MKNSSLLITILLVLSIACGGNETSDLPDDPEKQKLEEKIKITSINFKDSNLRDCIMALGKNYAVEVSVLECNSKNIEFLEGIQHFTNLTELKLSSNQISDVSQLSDLTKLQFLFLTSNLISDLTPLNSLQQLSLLGLGENQIVDLTPIKASANLTELYIDDNQISSFAPILGLQKLSKIRISYNPLETLSGISNFIRLKKLYADSVQLSDEDLLEISTMTNLSELTLAGNQLTNINPIKNLIELLFLVLSGNAITDVCELKWLDKLQALWIQSNQLTMGVNCLVTLTNISPQFKIQLEGNSMLPCDQVNSLASELGESRVVRPAQCPL